MKLLLILLTAITLNVADVPDRLILGTNLNGITDWGTEHTWKDMMKQSRAWAMNQTVTDLFTAANRHERMYDLYIEYFEQWGSLGGTVFANFSSVSSHGEFGAWGVLEYAEQDPAEAPKYRALMEILRRYPNSTALSGKGEKTALPVTGVTPNPFSRSVRLTFNTPLAGGTSIEIYDTRGIRVTSLNASGTSAVWDGKDNTGQPLPEGSYYYKANTAGRNINGQILPVR